MKICNIENCNNKHYGKGYCKKHHQSQWATPEYKTWVSIKYRCNNKKSINYKTYGGRGIKVCDEWLNNPKSFIKYIGPKPSTKHSIDRIDNDGNYEPGNVRWVTQHEQAMNKRHKLSKSGFVGVYRHNNKWQVQLKRHGNIKFIGSYSNIDDAVKARKTAEAVY